MPRWQASLSLVLILFAAYAYFNRGGINPDSRIDALHAIVIGGRLSIDDYHVNTGDKAYFNGHFYSEKAPGITLIALPAFILAHTVLSSMGISVDAPDGWTISRWITTVGSVGILSILGAVATFTMLRSYLSDRRAFLVTLLLFLGTIVLPYATMLFSHAGAVGLIAIALWAVSESPRRRASASMPYRDLLAGFCAGLAVASEYPAVIPAFGIFLLALASSPVRAAKVALGALPALVLIPLNNLAITGSLFVLPYVHHVTWPQMGIGFVNMGMPAVDRVTGLLWSPNRGLFFWSPFLLMALVGWCLPRRIPAALYGTSVLVFVLSVVGIAALPYWHGGGAIGPRYLAPTLPFLFVPVAVGFDFLPRVATALGGVSIALMLLATAIDPAPWDPLVRYMLPHALTTIDTGTNLGGVLGLHGVWSVLPLIVLLSIVIPLAASILGPRSNTSPLPS